MALFREKPILVLGLNRQFHCQKPKNPRSPGWKEAEMFDLANWSNQDALFLNLTNLALGLFTLWLLGGIVSTSLHEAWLRMKKHH